MPSCIHKGKGLKEIIMSTTRAAAVVLTLVATTTIASKVDAQCVHQATLSSADGAGLDEYYGNSVSIHGDVAIVGAREYYEVGPDSGTAYLFRYISEDDEWMEVERLVPSDHSPWMMFGHATAAAEDHVVVAAVQDAEGGMFAGALYVFHDSGNGWVEVAKLVAPDAEAGDHLGYSVDTHGDVIVTGVLGDDDQGTNAGAAYVYRRDGNSWNMEMKLTASDGGLNDWFGSSVAVHDDVIVVGAELADDSGTQSGAAYVYRFDGTTWVEEEKIAASDGFAGDRFGFAVDVAQDMMLVGAPQHDGADWNGGAAYLFAFDGEGWSESEKLLPDGYAVADEFGGSVAISSSRVVVGSHLDAGDNAGSIYIYSLNGSSLSPECSEITVPDDEGQVYGHFGSSVSVDGDLALCGGIGVACIFGADPDAPDPVVGDLDGDGFVGVLDLVQLVSAWGLCSGDCPEDLDGDGVVGTLDLIVLISNWDP
jgi:hypothetical protein